MKACLASDWYKLTDHLVSVLWFVGSGGYLMLHSFLHHAVYVSPKVNLMDVIIKNARIAVLICFSLSDHR